MELTRRILDTYNIGALVHVDFDHKFFDLIVIIFCMQIKKNKVFNSQFHIFSRSSKLLPKVKKTIQKANHIISITYIGGFWSFTFLLCRLTGIRSFAISLTQLVGTLHNCKDWDLFPRLKAFNNFYTNLGRKSLKTIFGSELLS